MSAPKKPRRFSTKADRDLAAFAESHGKELRQKQAAVEAEETKAWATAESKRLALVNAAPVMLAALRGLVQDADCDHSTEEGSGHRYVTVARIEQARAAIAKAEGK